MLDAVRQMNEKHHSSIHLIIYWPIGCLSRKKEYN